MSRLTPQEVLQFFTPVDEQHYRCKCCTEDAKALTQDKKGGIGNLRKHLASQHGNKCEEFLARNGTSLDHSKEPLLCIAHYSKEP
jgi:hypothetical protein